VRLATVRGFELLGVGGLAGMGSLGTESIWGMETVLLPGGS
jgi:hypothetical protein